MLSWIIILSTASYACSQVREIEYECGAHGRFEYCIDGVSGCVIGCHCHPGYYFDTDTKICEPNTKLTKNFRRQYDYSEPTRIHIPPLPVTPPVPEEPATTVKSAVDEKIDIITKDADDLGDWLYNQFFKTIENQLINETKDEGTLTRRSASAPDNFAKKPSRKSNKYWRARKKKKRKKHRMRSKLLRITEDDSLFDESGESSSTSDEDSESSDSSNSDTTSDESGSKEPKKKRKKNHEHGKEVVVYNKRPKPPLPSFIFLPNMETPFFPPIGLPPPAMPMYPMVPVPPVMGPYPQLPGHHTHEGEGVTKNNGKHNDDTDEHNHKESDTHSKDRPDVTNSKEKQQDQNTAKDLDKNYSDEKLDPGGGHSGAQDNSPNEPTSVEKKNSTGLAENGVEKTEDANKVNESEKNETELNEQNSQSLRMASRSRGSPRNKLIQRMREKLKRKNKLQKFFAAEYKQRPPRPPIDNPPANCPTFPEPNQPRNKCDLRDDLSKLQDVDFKYLSQLIHKGDLNKTNAIPPELHFLMNNPAVKLPQDPSRRSYDTNIDSNNLSQQNPYNVDQVLNNLNNIGNENPNTPTQQIRNQPFSSHDKQYKIPYRNKIEATNDTYYAHLGRQIAAMIRNIDADKDIDIEIEKGNKVPLLNRINQGSSSYWDRAVRSPYKTIKTSKNVYRKTQMHSLQKSNENLYSLENKVEIAASTKPTLGLHELENIVSKMERAKLSLTKLKTGKNIVRVGSSKTSFNVNLLPGNDHSYFARGIINKEPLRIPPKHIFNTSSKVKNTKESPLVIEPQKSYLSRFFKQFIVPSITVKNKNETTLHINTTPRLSVVSSNNTNYFRPLHYKMPNKNDHYTVLPQPFFPNIKFIKDTARQTHYHELNPMVLNRKSFNYYPVNNKQYVFQQASIPVKFPTMAYHIQPGNKSYFHQEHHFDYFDDLF